ncbi:MAG: hypothetical protein WC812_02170 [Candidatus Pacearchaeota archaeon]|jgi:hypothetical protein
MEEKTKKECSKLKKILRGIYHPEGIQLLIKDSLKRKKYASEKIEDISEIGEHLDNVKYIFYGATTFLLVYYEFFK